jgi:sensor histidine kinase regulating citrate/malate metabolism
MPLVGLLAIATLLSGLRTQREHRKWRIAGTVLTLLVVVLTVIWFVPNIIKLTGEGVMAMRPDEVTSLTNKWVSLNWLRAVLFLTAWLAALRALTIPPKVESDI